MPSFSVTVYARSVVCCVIEVDAKDKNEAKALALEEAQDDVGAQDWFTPDDDGVESSDIDESLTEVEED